MSALSLQCSERSRRADQAQREADDRYRAAWLEQHVGSEIDGVISVVTSFGLFIELAESKVTGLVHVTQLPNDYQHFAPIPTSLTRERSRRQYRLRDTPRTPAARKRPSAKSTTATAERGGSRTGAASSTA